MTSPLPAGMVEYLSRRDASRANAVEAFLMSLTARERALVSDIAVMGYVRGSMHPKGEPQPKRNPALAEVIDACFAFPDLYPAVDAVKSHTTGSKVEYFVEIQQHDTTWVQASGTSEKYDYIVEQAEKKLAKHPDWKIRIGWSITSITSGSISCSEPTV